MDDIREHAVTDVASGVGERQRVRDGANGLDFVAHLREQREFSRRTFVPDPRTAGVIAHIRKKLEELEADPYDLEGWIDVVLLACDGAWRHGHEPEAIAAALRAKLQKHKTRQPPDGRTVPHSC